MFYFILIMAVSKIKYTNACWLFFFFFFFEYCEILRTVVVVIDEWKTPRGEKIEDA